MSITEFAVRNQVLTWLIAVLTAVGGLISYDKLGKLEDPEFTIKTAIIATRYPGAGPVQVEKEVTERIEIALQEMPEIDFVESISRAGLSTIKVQIKSHYWSDELPQIWDVLRRKIRNIEDSLPVGAQRPIVRDDFGDVFGFVLAVTGDGYSYKALEHEVKELKRRLSLVEDVSRVEFWGKKPRAVYLKINESHLAKLGITASDIAQAFAQQNDLRASGHVYYTEKSARIEVTGEFSSIADVEKLALRVSKLSEIVSGQSQDQLITIGDIAKVEEALIEPAQQTMRYNGQPAIALAISNVSGANILKLGERLDQRLADLQAQIPVGIDVHKVSWQAQEVAVAIDSFVSSLVQAVVIVLLVLAVAMGWRMGIIIGTALILTILGTFIFMRLFGIDLQRISLGSLVIALGMMVDNAIVVGDGALVRLRQGRDRVAAVVESARGPSLPLLGATVIAVLAFYPIGSSTESVGEYCLTLFQVVSISLLLSWLVSVTVTPLQCLVMLKADDAPEESADPYASRFYRHYRALLEQAVHHRVLTLGAVAVLLGLSLWGFKFIPQMFFPEATRPQFMVDIYAPTGTRVPYTSQLLRKVEDKVSAMPGVDSVSTFIGSGPPRFYLPVEPELFYPSYGQLIVNVEDYRQIAAISDELQPWLRENLPEASTARVRRYTAGPGNAWQFEVRILAPDTAGLGEIRAIGNQALPLVKHHPLVKDSRLEARELSPKVVVEYDQNQGRWTRITRSDVEDATQRAFDGLPVGQFREGDDLLPILLRNQSAERDNPAALFSVQVPQSLSGERVPLTQITDSIQLQWEDPLIMRRNRQRMMTVQAQPVDGVTLPTLRADVLAAFERFEQNLPPGYSMEWGAETESSADAQASLIPGMIPATLLMFLIIVALFNSMKPALIIGLALPLVLIGITVGLLSTGASFGFMALLGALSLAGMMTKNAIVLLDEVNLNMHTHGLSHYDAVINAGLSRLRPVALAASTTALGVIPLLPDILWASMAITIMFGLVFGTLLTMIIVPVLYTAVYKVQLQ